MSSSSGGGIMSISRVSNMMRAQLMAKQLAIGTGAVIYLNINLKRNAIQRTPIE
jgi:hypothetical protein